MKTGNRNKLIQKKTKKQNWQERMIEGFGKNPLKCERCGREMELWRIWHPKYGNIYDMMRDGNEEKPKEERAVGRGSPTDPVSGRQSVHLLQVSLSGL